MKSSENKLFWLMTAALVATLATLITLNIVLIHNRIAPSAPNDIAFDEDGINSPFNDTVSPFDLED